MTNKEQYRNCKRKKLKSEKCRGSDSHWLQRRKVLRLINLLHQVLTILNRIPQFYSRYWR